MNDDCARILNLIAAYADFVGFHVSNTTTHIVTEDDNLTDGNLDFQLKWIEDHRAEWADKESEFYVSEEDIQIAIAFLNFLRVIPEDRRCVCEEDEDVDTPPLEGKKSDDWIERHGGR